MSTWRAITFDGLDTYAADAAIGEKGMFQDYGDYGGALSDYGILDDLGLGPEATVIIPPALGAAVAFGTTLAVRYFVKSRTSAWYNYAGLLGAVGSLVPAYALWKYQGKGAAITAATAGVLTGLGLWLMPKIEASGALGAYVALDPVPLLQAYEVEEGVPVLQEAPELLSEAPELLSEAPELLSEAPEILSGQNVQGWSPAFV